MEESVVAVLEAMIARTTAVVEQLTNDMQLRERTNRAKSKADDYADHPDPADAPDGAPEDYYAEYTNGRMGYGDMVESYQELGLWSDRSEYEMPVLTNEELSSIAKSWMDDLDNYEDDLADGLDRWWSAAQTLTKIRMAIILGRSEWMVLHNDSSSGVSVVISRDCCSKITLGYGGLQPGETTGLQRLNTLLDTNEPLLEPVWIPTDYIDQLGGGAYDPERSLQVLGGLQGGTVNLADDVVMRSDDNGACGLGFVFVGGRGAESGFDSIFRNPSDDGPATPDCTCLVALMERHRVSSVGAEKAAHRLELFEDDIPF